MDKFKDGERYRYMPLDPRHVTRYPEGEVEVVYDGPDRYGYVRVQYVKPEGAMCSDWFEVLSVRLSPIVPDSKITVEFERKVVEKKKITFSGSESDLIRQAATFFKAHSGSDDSIRLQRIGVVNFIADQIAWGDLDYTNFQKQDVILKAIREQNK